MEWWDVERRRQAAGNLPVPSQPEPSSGSAQWEEFILSFQGESTGKKKEKRENIKVTSY